jgi:hypothetical protein
MKTRLVITDLTRMYHKNVCIAGYTAGRQCIRPISIGGGIPEAILYHDQQAIIYPFAEIELELLKPLGKKPHIEDYSFNPWSLRFIREVDSREKILHWSLFENVEAIFEQEIHIDPGFYVLDCQGARSLGSMIPSKILEVLYEPGTEGNWDYRMAFIDGAGRVYRLKIVDLTWQYYCASLKDETRAPKEIASIISQDISNRRVFLRIGLARGWKKYPERCYLQITGIFTFPDYLENKNFSQFTKIETS